MKWHPLALAGLALIALDVATAQAADCPGNPNALGTSRVLSIDPKDYPRIGTVQYSRSLPLEDKEVVLTFDDGPMPPYTNRVLEALAHECIKANYFIVGRIRRHRPPSPSLRRTNRRLPGPSRFRSWKSSARCRSTLTPRRSHSRTRSRSPVR